MALYMRSPIRQACRLACSHHVVMQMCKPAISCLLIIPLPRTSLCLSSYYGAENRRLTSSIPWLSNTQGVSTAGVLYNYGGLFHRCDHDRTFFPSYSCDGKISSGSGFLCDSTRVQAYRKYHRKYCKKAEEEPKPPLPSSDAKPSIWIRFKDMYKEYWYVLVPVHVFTSIIWYGSFFYIASSGFDLVHFLENMNAPESIINPLRNSKAGYFAIAYAMYKIATPARYTVTLGGTTVSINYLKKWGYIKPMPNSAAIQKMIKDKRAAFQQGLHNRQAARREKQEKKRSSQGGPKKP